MISATPAMIIMMATTSTAEAVAVTTLPRAMMPAIRKMTPNPTIHPHLARSACRSSPSRSIHSDCRVQVLELDACVGGCEVPVGLCVIGISVVLPGLYFVDEGLLVGDTPIEALAG